MQSSVRIPLRSGLTLATVFETPSVDGARPCVILLHGFTGWKEEAHIETLAGALSKAGIASIRFDAPGSGESDGTFADHYRLSTYIESVSEVLDWSASQPEVDSNRIGIWGHSMGGFAAIASAHRYADRIRAVCGCQPSRGRSGVTDEERESWERTGRASFPNLHFRTLELPYAFYLDRQQFDVFDILPELDVPLQLIAGSRDTLVSPRHVHKMFEAANDPKEIHEYNVDHFYKKSARQCAQINTVIVNFFERYLEFDTNS